MAQNRSTAVMQRKRVVAPDNLNYFPTPPFATRALIEFLRDELGDLSQLTAWEPGCGEMHMSRPLAEAFASVRSSDVHRYCDEHELIDFALTGATEPAVDVIASNPPFKLAEEFIATGLKVARRAVCMLVRSAFLEGQARFLSLYSSTPPSYVLQFCERVVLLEGRLVRAGAVDPFAEKEGNKASTATAYVWLVWIIGKEGETVLRWLPPSFRRLEQPGDYPAYSVEAAQETPERFFESVE